MRLWGITRPCVPDAFTLANACCGALAVLVLVRATAGDTFVGGLSALQVVSLLLVLGTVFDSLDGAAARILGGSGLGGPLDSLADGVTFGMVPAATLTTIALGGGYADPAAATVVVIGFLVYLSGALLRLADFSALRCDDHDFVGLPSPLAALLAVAAAYTTSEPVLLGLVLVGIGYLMVCGLRFPHQGREMLPLAVLGWALVVCGALRVVEPALLVAATYVLVLVVLPVLARRSRRREGDGVDEVREVEGPVEGPGASARARALLTD